MNRWSDAFSKKQQARKTNKYSAKRTELRGISFASQFEAQLYGQFLLMEKSGLISNIRTQVSIALTPSINWKADFIVFDNEINEDVICEAKGFEDLRWQVLKKLLKDYAPMRTRVYKKSGNRIFVHEEFEKGIDLNSLKKS